MLIYSMSVSADGFVNDRDGGIDWGEPSDELFAFHLDRVAGLSAHLCGRRLYETMLVWETDASLRETELGSRFAEAWAALPKVVFSRTLDTVSGNTRLADGPLGEEISLALASGGDVEVGGAELAAAAIGLGLVDDFRIFRHPVVLGGGTPYFPAVADPVALDLVETRNFGSRVVYERYRRASAPRH